MQASGFDVFKDVSQGLAAIVGATVAVVAAKSYVQNRRLERAKWAFKLYEFFYALSPRLKDVRDRLDCEPESVEHLGQLLEKS